MDLRPRLHEAEIDTLRAREQCDVLGRQLQAAESAVQQALGRARALRELVDAEEAPQPEFDA